MGGWDSSWRNFDPSRRTAKPEVDTKRVNGAVGDRGTRRGAKRVIVDDIFNIYDHAVAKAATPPIVGEFFQSRKEAKRYIALAGAVKAGMMRPSPLYQSRGKVSWRQVPFPLHTRRQDGLKVEVCRIVIDFVYEMIGGSVRGENLWTLVVEDVKPSGGHREDAYLLKKKWFEAEYGLTINEF